MAHNPYTEMMTVEEVKDGRVQMSDGMSWPGNCFPPDVAVGERYLVQVVQGSLPVTVAKVFFHKTEEDLEAERQASIADSRRRHEEMLAENREDWLRRENALPHPLQKRLDNFRFKAGFHVFQREGWGYELVVSELAVMYAETAGEYSDEIRAYDTAEGCSGNQHDYAKALARLLTADPDSVPETVAALAPLGVGNYYEKADR